MTLNNIPKNMTKSHTYLIRKVNNTIRANHQLSVTDVYFSDNTLLFLLTEATFLDTKILQDLKRALRTNDMLAMVGSILVFNYVHQVEFVSYKLNVIEGEFEVSPAKPVETMDVLSLIADHQDRFSGS
jgi:hypothetical protein